MKKLEELLQEIQQHCQNSNRKALNSALREIMENRRHYYHNSINSQLLDELSDSFYKILLLELDKEEEESIETAELAYLAVSSILKQQENSTPEQYKRRMLLLHYFSDYFTDSIIEIFLKKYKQENLLQARQLAIECLEKMQITDIFHLETNYPEFINSDEQLNEACNMIRINPNLTEEEQQEALLLHKVMHAYLTAKYKN